MNTLMDSLPRRHRITVDDYHRMAEAGLFGPDERVELIDGEVFDMAPIGPGHNGTLNRLNRQLMQAVKSAAIVQIQGSIRLGNDSEPQPDVAVLAPRADDYVHALPTAADVLLVIEVSDKTLGTDLGTKLSLYARHGIREYWVADLPHLQLHVFRAPREDRYTEQRSIAEPGRMAVPGLPGVEVDLSGLFAYLAP